MLLVSSHVLDCKEIELPENTVIRVNLAWVNSKEEAIERIKEMPFLVFLDHPSGRKKPPSNHYSMRDIGDIVDACHNIKYVAVSNVEFADDIEALESYISYSTILVPKIETMSGILNIGEIVYALKRGQRVIMLDHDDLYADLVKNHVDPAILYTTYINPLLNFCKQNGVEVLRTQGVVFSTEC